MIGRFSPIAPDAHALPDRQPLTDHDATELLRNDDVAALCAEQLLNAAMLDHVRTAGAAPTSRGGVCTNCGEVCLPLAVYCDSDCRDDHEERLQVQRRQGAAR